MRAFLDFEASSLAKASYPIEVAWVFEDGAGEQRLIAPAPDWTDWDDTAEAIHGIERDRLLREGEPPQAVATAMIAALQGCALYASAPSWDGKWLSVLLRAAGLPRHALRLEDTEAAEADAVAEVLRDRLRPEALARATREILEAVREERGRWPVRHRARPDAELERRAYCRARELAEAAAQALRPSAAGANPG